MTNACSEHVRQVHSDGVMGGCGCPLAREVALIWNHCLQLD
jgi:hypothetical protein